MPPRRTTKNPYRKTYHTNPWKTTTTTHTPTASYPCNSPKFKGAREECQWRIGSYRNVYSQFAGASMTPFSPTTANKWVRYINAGARVYKFNNAEFCKYFGRTWAYSTPTATRQYLKQKFGPWVKDVTRGNANCWLVATTKNVTGRPFINYHWK